LCSSGRTSGRSGQTEHQPEKRVIWPRTPSTASLTMPGQGCPRLPVESTRTWLQQQYYSERRRSHPPPWGGVSRENSRISWRMPRSNGPKDLPPKGKGTPPEHRVATSRFMREASVHTGRTRDATSAAPGRLGNEHHRRDRRAHLDDKVHRTTLQSRPNHLGDATTAGRIGVPRPNHLVRKLSAGPYDRRRS
jgi:hypothetical protein